MNQETLNMFAIFELAIGVYFAYLAIVGKGNAFNTEYAKEGKEEIYKKGLRISYAIFSPMLIALAAADYYSTVPGYEYLKVWQLIIWIAIFVVIVGVFIFSLKMTDKKKKESAKTAIKGKKPLPPSTWGDEDPEDQPEKK